MKLLRVALERLDKENNETHVELAEATQSDKDEEEEEEVGEEDNDNGNDILNK